VADAKIPNKEKTSVSEFNHHFRGATILNAVQRNMEVQGRRIWTALDYQLAELTLAAFDQHAERPLEHFVAMPGDDRETVATPIDPKLSAIAKALATPPDPLCEQPKAAPATTVEPRFAIVGPGEEKAA
jgi:hypothetical protein